MDKTTVITVLDNFIKDFKPFQEHAKSREYGTVHNPYDNVDYPDISTDIPPHILAEIKRKLEALMGREVTFKAAFMRLTSQYTQGAPHQAHTDSAMGTYTFMYYLQDGCEKCGTSLVEHKETGMRTDPKTPEEFRAWQEDTNNPEAWEIYEMVKMKANRAALFPSHYMHRAEPIGGFGKSAKDGRVALTIFFD